MISLQIAWQPNTIVPGHWCLEYKKHSNENLFDLAQKELHGREYPPLALWSECQRHDFWTGSVWKTSTARASELLFGQILHSSLQWILKIWCRCNKCLTFSLFLTFGRQVALTCYIPTSDTSCFRCGSGIKKTVSLYFGFFFLSLFPALSWTWSCYNAAVTDFSTRDSSHAFLCLPPSVPPPPLAHPPFPSPICLLQACVYLTEGRADSLVYSNAASSSVFITVTSLNPTFPATF